MMKMLVLEAAKNKKPPLLLTMILLVLSMIKKDTSTPVVGGGDDDGGDKIFTWDNTSAKRSRINKESDRKKNNVKEGAKNVKIIRK